MLAYTLFPLLLVAPGQEGGIIPPSERIAHVNKLANRLSGPNAADLYERAWEQYVDVFELDPEATGEDLTDAWSDSALDLGVLAAKPQWNAREVRIIREWLKANSRALELVQEATARERCFFKIDERSGRLSSALVNSTRVEFFRLVKLARVRANERAIADDWPAAFRWNLEVHRMADHAYQQPATIQQLGGMMVERLACQQFLAFLNRHDLGNLPTLLEGIRAGDDARCPESVTEEVENLWARDYIELWHLWAKDPSSQPEQQEVAESVIEIREMVGEEVESLGVTPFKSVDEIREALLRSSVDREWEVLQRLDALLHGWDQQPFYKAWKQAETVERKYCAIMREAPALSVNGCGPLASTQLRLLRVETAMSRSALETVVALERYRQRLGRLPETLEALVPGFVREVPLDPFTGRPFIFRTTDGSRGYTLYSAGSDQDDDWGRHTEDLRGDGDRVFWPPAE